MATDRTYRAAIDAGCCFEVRNPSGTVCRLFPAADTIDEAIVFSLLSSKLAPRDEVVVYQHLPGSRIGGVLLREVFAGRVTPQHQLAAQKLLPDRIRAWLAATPMTGQQLAGLLPIRPHILARALKTLLADSLVAFDDVTSTWRLVS